MYTEISIFKREIFWYTGIADIKPHALELINYSRFNP